MANREQIELTLADLSQQRDEAEAAGMHARDRLARLASGITPLEDLNADELEGAADDFAAAVRKLQLIDQFRSRLRKLLI